MTRVLAFVALALAGCDLPPPGPELPIDLTISRALGAPIGQLQVALVSKGRALDCAALQGKCLRSVVDLDRLETLADATGRQKKALRFEVAPLADGGVAQNLSVGGVPVGRDYALVIEALTAESPPRLAGSACNHIAKVDSGRNDAVLAVITPAGAAPAACDPRID